ncbi:hypothetical protein [Leucothrix arctica]|uniref:Lipoprotein n=1 Tax=Leucothrix arctica TaxID=1481894 RepID=A0A317CLJ5_9GAMM|nr:hypothetical protein [Leucothrix arctica]PWQ99239.1 hypothetical protein DKT75_01450 [Leucothrix arctica]
MFIRNLIGVTSASILLVACHSDDHVTVTESVSIASAAYQGSKVAATQTNATASYFSRSAFAARDYSLSAAGISAYLPALDTYGSETCSNGGSASQVKNIDATSLLGSKTITFNNCMIGDVLTDGNTIIEVTGYDQMLSMPTALKTTYNGLSQTKDDKTIILTGTVEATQDLDTKSVELVLDTHMLAGTGEEVLTEMTIVVIGNTVKRSASSQYTGDVCIDTEGCVNFTTQVPFLVEYNGYLTAGEMTSTGENSNTAKIVVDESNSVAINLVAESS